MGSSCCGRGGDKASSAREACEDSEERGTSYSESWCDDVCESTAACQLLQREAQAVRVLLTLRVSAHIFTIVFFFTLPKPVERSDEYAAMNDCQTYVFHLVICAYSEHLLCIYPLETYLMPASSSHILSTHS